MKTLHAPDRFCGDNNIVHYLIDPGKPAQNRIVAQSHRESIYFGDMLFPGGNDESVIGVIKTVSVDNPVDTLAKLVALHTKTLI